MVKEDKLVERIARALQQGNPSRKSGDLRLGMGDDAAIVAPTRKREWVLSCDAFLEGVHFLTQTDPPDSVGYKSLVRATSDLAAMGASPRFFLLTLALPEGRTGKWLDRFLAGMNRASRLLRILLAGGDTTRDVKISISITVIGEIAPGRAIKRSGARPGDGIYVTGRLGGAALGLALIHRAPAWGKGVRHLLQPHLYPRIRLELGAWLSQQRMASSMMDISDGLSTDLSRLCTASRVGACISAARVPCLNVPASQLKWLAKLKIDPLQLALHGGDDYGLLFTVPQKFATRLRRAPDFSQITQIGEITSERQISLVDPQGRARPLKPHGWDPFRKEPTKQARY